MERVQQVLDASVTPTLSVEIMPLRENEGHTEGALVLAVPASWSAPHEYDGRFPARSGATTRYLNEREVEALYLRRWELRQQGEAQVGIEGHRRVFPSGASTIENVVRREDALGDHRGPRRPAEYAPVVARDDMQGPLKMELDGLDSPKS